MQRVKWSGHSQYLSKSEALLHLPVTPTLRLVHRYRRPILDLVQNYLLAIHLPDTPVTRIVLNLVTIKETMLDKKLNEILNRFGWPVRGDRRYATYSSPQTTVLPFAKHTHSHCNNSPPTFASTAGGLGTAECVLPISSNLSNWKYW